MNAHAMHRELAVSPALARCETRDVNPYDRIIYSPAADRYQVLGPFRGGRMRRRGSYESLADALAARDAEQEGE